jgi:hypothetical protein
VRARIPPQVGGRSGGVMNRHPRLPTPRFQPWSSGGDRPTLLG